MIILFYVFIESTKVINVSNSSGVHIGNVHNYSLFTNGSKDKENDSFKNKHSRTAGAEVRTPEVNQILSSDKLMKRGHLDIVATHLGEGWRDVGMKLGYSNGQLDHFYADFKHIGTKEVNIQVFFTCSSYYAFLKNYQMQLRLNITSQFSRRD